jgi:hypothetical protein
LYKDEHWDKPKAMGKKCSKTYNYKSKAMDIRKSTGALDES